MDQVLWLCRVCKLQKSRDVRREHEEGRPRRKEESQKRKMSWKLNKELISGRKEK